MPVTFQPRRSADRVTALMTALSPGASPPPVFTRICMFLEAISRLAPDGNWDAIRGAGSPAGDLGRSAVADAGAERLQLGGQLDGGRHGRCGLVFEVPLHPVLDPQLAELPVEPGLGVVGERQLGALVERVVASLSAHD